MELALEGRGYSKTAHCVRLGFFGKIVSGRRLLSFTRLSVASNMKASVCGCHTPLELALVRPEGAAGILGPDGNLKGRLR